MPVYVAAIPGLILVLVQLYRDATGWEARRGGGGGGIDMDEVYETKLDRKTEFRRTVTYFPGSSAVLSVFGCWAS